MTPAWLQLASEVCTLVIVPIMAYIYALNLKMDRFELTIEKLRAEMYRDYVPKHDYIYRRTIMENGD
jgi:hypothetical protein